MRMCTRLLTTEKSFEWICEIWMGLRKEFWHECIYDFTSRVSSNSSRALSASVTKIWWQGVEEEIVPIHVGIPSQKVNSEQ